MIWQPETLKIAGHGSLGKLRLKLYQHMEGEASFVWTSPKTHDRAFQLGGETKCTSFSRYVEETVGAYDLDMELLKDKPRGTCR
jgi:hypothetical protein